MTPTRSSSGPTSVDDLRNHSPIYGTGRRFKGKRQDRTEQLFSAYRGLTLRPLATIVSKQALDMCWLSD